MQRSDIGVDLVPRTAVLRVLVAVRDLSVQDARVKYCC